MSRRAAAQASSMVPRGLRSSPRLCRSPLSSRVASAIPRSLAPRVASAVSFRGFFSTSANREKGIMPDSSDPAKPEPEAEHTSFAIVDLSDSEYHELADEYLENVVLRFEELQDAREDVDVEFSSGVLTITWPETGTYVINKQPPNKQIWLSSPISGPKRYDWCLVGEGQGDKEGTAVGNWIYARDGSSLSQVFLDELGVDVEEPGEDL